MYLFLHLRPPIGYPFHLCLFLNLLPTVTPGSPCSEQIQPEAAAATGPGLQVHSVLCSKEELLLEQTPTRWWSLSAFSNEPGQPGQPGLPPGRNHGRPQREQGEIIFVFGDAGMGKSMLLQRLQSLWAAGQLDPGIKDSSSTSAAAPSAASEERGTVSAGPALQALLLPRAGPRGEVLPSCCAFPPHGPLHL